MNMSKMHMPLEWLCSPVEKETLKLKEDTLISENGEVYNKEDGHYWNFIPRDLKLFDNELWESWNVLQNNGVASYTADASNNLGVGPRADFMEFAEFCNFKGMVLDIGVGPQKCPTHIEYNKKEDVFFVGIDPLVGEQPRDFEFIQALGEYLPFKNEIFDQVLFVTTLDHFIDPVAALKEAKRVMKANGEICVWLGEKDKNAPKPKESPEWYRKLEIPHGAEDPFHFKRFSIQEFYDYLPLAGLRIKEEIITEKDQWRKSCFYKIVRES